MELFDSLKFKVVRRNIKIVFPEATDPRILGAAARLKSDELVEPILIGDPTDIANAAMARGINTSNFIIINPNDYEKWDEMVEAFVERRNGKATKEDAEKILKDVNYFGTMLTYMGIADGMVSGAIHSTGDTVRPALQIIKTKPGVSRTSGAFLMIRGRDQERYLFSDCAINVNPTAQELAEIAIDGELQFDASYVSSVAQLKAPNSKVAGEATVFVFPDLQSGNIGYKIAQRLGNFEAIGPILQGLNKPVSDLSRGANEEDVYKLSIITAAQTLMND